jgi:hypothetical protein
VLCEERPCVVVEVLGQENEHDVVRVEAETTGNAPLPLPARIFRGVGVEFVDERRFPPDRVGPIERRRAGARE